MSHSQLAQLLLLGFQAGNLLKIQNQSHPTNNQLSVGGAKRLRGQFNYYIKIHHYKYDTIMKSFKVVGFAGICFQFANGFVG